MTSFIISFSTKYYLPYFYTQNSFEEPLSSIPIKKRFSTRSTFEISHSNSSESPSSQKTKYFKLHSTPLLSSHSSSSTSSNSPSTASTLFTGAGVSIYKSYASPISAINRAYERSGFSYWLHRVGGYLAGSNITTHHNSGNGKEKRTTHINEERSEFHEDGNEEDFNSLGDFDFDDSRSKLDQRLFNSSLLSGSGLPNSNSSTILPDGTV